MKGGGAAPHRPLVEGGIPVPPQSLERAPVPPHPLGRGGMTRGQGFAAEEAVSPSSEAACERGGYDGGEGVQDRGDIEAGGFEGDYSERGL